MQNQVPVIYSDAVSYTKILFLYDLPHLDFGINGSKIYVWCKPSNTFYDMFLILHAHLLIMRQFHGEGGCA